MKKGDIENVTAKYNSGFTTLEEDRLLRDPKNSSSSLIHSWLAKVTQKKESIPEYLNDSLWIAFEQTKRRKQRVLYSRISIAASVVFCLALLLNYNKTSELSYAKKEALLNEVLSMYVSTKEMNHNIIYQDDLVIIYTNN